MPLRFRVAGVLAMVVATHLCAVTASAQSLAWIGGAQYAAGSFSFGQFTWTANVSNGLAWTSGRLRTSASLPIVAQDQSFVQYSGAGMMVPTGGMGTRADSAGTAGGMMAGGMGAGMHGAGTTGMLFGHVGIGDPVARAELALTSPANPDRMLSIVASVKAPLAGRASGIGTGEWDVGAGVSTALRVGGSFLFGDAVYWRLGNPAGWSLHNAVAYNVAVGRPVQGGRWSVLGSVYGATRIWSGLPAPVQAGAGVTHLLESGSSLSASVAVGLSRAAPGITIGLGWRVPLTP